MSDRRFEVVLREVARRGGGEAELHEVRSRARRYEAREGRLDTIAFSDTRSLGLRLFREGRMGFSYGFVGDDADLARMVEEAAFCAASSDPDDAYGLPDIEGPPPELALCDPAGEAVSEEEKGEFARSLEAGVLAIDPRMKRVRTAALNDTVTEVSLVNSRGVSCGRRESRCFAHVETVAEEGGEGQTGYGFGFARSLRGLSVSSIAGEGAERALRMLGAVRPKTGEYRAVLENGAAAELLEVLGPSFLAPQVAKGKSMLAGKVGVRLASGAVAVADDPLDPAGSGAEPFDGEGTPAGRRELIAAGVLRGYLADAFWGRKIGTGSTGACRRPAAKQPPAVGASNLCIPPGVRSFDALLAAAGNGVLLTEFLGIHTADPVSGDFSVGASGLRIAGGALAEPLHGFAVSGNVLDLLENVEAAGNDFRWFGAVGAPSLLVGRISLGGD
ncbi:MAG: putative zinc protease PmbA [Deltaproteobacteria bacterium]|nr:putative zinc protease PmbA [Deltaproteobacteria bacterium]